MEYFAATNKKPSSKRPGQFAPSVAPPRAPHPHAHPGCPPPLGHDALAPAQQQHAADPGGATLSVASLVERFVDNRRRRQQTIDAHLDEVEDALAQGDPVK